MGEKEPVENDSGDEDDNDRSVELGDSSTGDTLVVTDRNIGRGPFGPLPGEEDHIIQGSPEMDA